MSSMSMISGPVLLDWSTTISLVFGGCCSNAITLEQLTVQHPNVGSLVTFCQFLLVSLHGIRKFLVFKRGRFGIPILSLRPRRVPLSAYAIQVILYSTVSLLNNAAFAYMIPMSVHIIFRSGGLAVGLIIGVITGRRYSYGQIVAVLLVTAGVILTTASAAHRPAQTKTYTTSSTEAPLLTYLTGVTILTVALILSGILGAVQDHTYSKYSTFSNTDKSSSSSPPPWEESMFYLHFLSLPTFLPLSYDIIAQGSILAANPSSMSIPILSPTLDFASSFTSPSIIRLRSLRISGALVLLALNTFAQLFCAAGVNRLTTRVTSLTVTLVLVVRKAVSLLLSVLFLGRGEQMEHRDMLMLWGGATLVFLGTVVYTISSRRPTVAVKEKEQ